MASRTKPDEPLEPEHWTDELMAERLAFIHKFRDYIVAIKTEIDQDPEHPSTINITFKLLKKKGVTV